MCFKHETIFVQLLLPTTLSNRYSNFSQEKIKVPLFLFSNFNFIPVSNYSDLILVCLLCIKANFIFRYFCYVCLLSIAVLIYY